MPTQPNLGYGTRGEVPIDAYNQWQRQQPWYQALIKSFGQNPNDVHLTDNQKQQVIRAAQANGVVVDEGHNGQEVDDSGNFQAKSHALRNTLIVAGIAGAALLTAGAAGVLGGAGAGGGAAAGSGGAAAAALGPSTAANLAATAGIVGGAGVPTSLAAAGGAGTLGSLAGVGKFLSTPGGSTLASSLGGVFTNIYGANKQADAARYGVDAQTAAEKYAADLSDAAAQRAEAFSRQQAETGWQSGELTQKANYDQWAARQRAITGSLGQQLGINYTLPDYVPGIDPRFTDGGAPSAGALSTGAPAAASSAQGNAAALKALLDAGADPKSAVTQFNQKYGRTTGNEAVYYDPSQHGGVATIGLPDAYLAKPGASWDITQRSGAAAPTRTAAPGTIASFVSPSFAAMQPNTALPTPYQPGTIGAYLRRA